MKQVVISNNDAAQVIAEVLNAQKTRRRGTYHYQVEYQPDSVVLSSNESGAMGALIKYLTGRYNFSIQRG